MRAAHKLFSYIKAEGIRGTNWKYWIFPKPQNSSLIHEMLLRISTTSGFDWLPADDKKPLEKNHFLFFSLFFLTSNGLTCRNDIGKVADVETEDWFCDAGIARNFSVFILFRKLVAFRNSLHLATDDLSEWTMCLINLNNRVIASVHLWKTKWTLWLGSSKQEPAHIRCSVQKYTFHAIDECGS